MLYTSKYSVCESIRMPEPVRPKENLPEGLMPRIIDLTLTDGQQELCALLLRTGLFGQSLADCVERLLSRQLLEFEAAGYFAGYFREKIDTHALHRDD